ncbi:uncharacterized protein PHACADRAFT_189815 [Phanerochaete carnosa HHB-10118-sp]|uniref:Uncharacterized protein n=1 Tax=Phanerochaete carnosa (strain HHB-10118-sp) TaxID=650164 RepID=K5WNA0_PHACS|nr:uncharacterized protein PHACADRAFT_189815 [Phanerochaete carnosa HHB-10118-sp]EKM60694.1 hypothetical protein PHACADRAFT_189815 [Phanerochaete carnosa HHB-10118-sp]
MIKEEESGRSPQWTASSDCDYSHEEQAESCADQSWLSLLTEQSEGKADVSLGARKGALFYLEAPEDVSNNSTREEENARDEIPLAAQVMGEIDKMYAELGQIGMELVTAHDSDLSAR